MFALCLLWFVFFIAEHWLAGQPITHNKSTKPKSKANSPHQQTQLFISLASPATAKKWRIVLFASLACRAAFGCLGWAPFRFRSRAGSANQPFHQKKVKLSFWFHYWFGLLFSFSSIPLFCLLPLLIDSFGLLVFSLGLLPMALCAHNPQTKRATKPNKPNQTPEAHISQPSLKIKSQIDDFIIEHWPAYVR